MMVILEGQSSVLQWLIIYLHLYHVRFVQNNDLIRILYLFFIYYLFYNEKSKVVEGLNILTGFTISPKLSWMNNLILALEISGSVFSQKFKATG